MASDLVVERLEGECEEFYLFPTLLGKCGVTPVDAAGESFRSSEGIEFSLTQNRLEVFGADINHGFSEIRVFLGLVGWRKARVSGDPEWVKKVLCAPGSVEFIVDGDDVAAAIPAQKIDFVDTDGGDLPPLPFSEPVATETEVIVEPDVVVEPENALPEFGPAIVEPDVEEVAAALIQAMDLAPTPVLSEPDMPALFRCDALSNGLISVDEEPELVEARKCVEEYLRRLGFAESVEARAYISMQNDMVREFMVTFAVLSK